MRFRIALLAFGMAACGFGQTLAADIPFQFHIGDQRFASGRYILSPGVSSADLNIVWAMRSSETGSTIMLHTRAVLPARSVTGLRLVFNKYTNTYFLSEVWTTEGRPGLQVPAAKRERELAKSTLRGEMVTVNLGR